MHYLSEMVTMKSGPELLALRLFPNAKEVSESFGAYNAIRTHLPELKFNNPNITMIAVGDGMRPRTAATFAFRSAWKCHSVDPVLKELGRWKRIERLKVWPNRIQDITIEADIAVIVAVHSHALLSASVESVKARQIYVIANPCCVPMVLDRPPDIEYQDMQILSKCRTIKIWRPTI